MTEEIVSNISVIDPIAPAIERVKVILFKPFDLKKWFVIGFCVWLAYLGKGGGGGGGTHERVVKLQTGPVVLPELLTSSIRQ